MDANEEYAKQRRRQHRQAAQFKRENQEQTFGKEFWNLTLEAARVADPTGQCADIFSATFFARRDISIPDQQYRSFRLCHALCEASIVNPTKTVAIVGAGISGMTCAVALAVRARCIVHVYERDPKLLRRLWEAPFRYLHPNLNTWATSSPTYPYDPTVSTLFPMMNWRADYAPFVAEQFSREFLHCRHCLPIAVLLGVPVADVSLRDGRPVIYLESDMSLRSPISDTRRLLEAFANLLAPLKECEGLENIEPSHELLQEIRSTAHSLKYDAVIVATGFGSERRAVAAGRTTPLTGDYSYWHSGNPALYTAPQRAKTSRRKRVLIAGNGESAIIELANYLLRDFAHHQIFNLLPSSGWNWIDFVGTVNRMRYRAIEAGEPDQYGISGPISWYWARRKRMSCGSDSLARQEEVEPAWPEALRYEQRIYDELDRELGSMAIGSQLPEATIAKLQTVVANELDELASHEIEASLNKEVRREQYDADKITADLSDDWDVTVIGRTPTIYSRGQAPATWNLIRVLCEFAPRGRIEYRQGEVTQAQSVDGAVEVTVDGLKRPLDTVSNVSNNSSSSIKHKVDTIVSRMGPTHDMGLIRQLEPAKAIVSRHALAGNPIPGSSTPLLPHENQDPLSYLSFLLEYFRTSLLRQTVRSRRVRMLAHEDAIDRDPNDGTDLDDGADLDVVRIHWWGTDSDRADAEKLFRGFKSGVSFKARWEARRKLGELVHQVRFRDER